MSRQPYISILMTVYNNERYFPIAVRNIIAQDFGNWELIIVDDGSTDNTPQIADELAKLDERITVIHHKTNQWVYAALNHAMEYATGEYIFVHNSDDLIVSGSLKLMAEKAHEYNADIVWVPVLYHICDENQNIIEYDYMNYEPQYQEEKVCLSKQDVESNWLNFWEKALSNNQVNLYRAELMKKHRFVEDIFIADAVFNMDIADEISRTVTLGKPIYMCFRYRAQNQFNASYGKWYDNEHEMFNLKHKRIIDLFIKWKRPREELLYWDEQRILDFNTEMTALVKYCKTIPACEKIRMLRGYCREPLLWGCVARLSRKDEVRSKVVGYIKLLKSEAGNEFQDELETGQCFAAADLVPWTNKSHQFDRLGKYMLQRKRIYIYGAGVAGEEVYKQLCFLNCVDAFIDRSEVKQREGFCGVKVIPPDDVLLNGNDGHLILLAIKNAEVLSAMGRSLQLAGYIKGLDFFPYQEFLPLCNDRNNYSDSLIYRVFCTYAHDVIWMKSLAVDMGDVIENLRKDVQLISSWNIYVNELQIINGDNLVTDNLEDFIGYLFDNYNSSFGKAVIFIKDNTSLSVTLLNQLKKFDVEVKLITSDGYGKIDKKLFSELNKYGLRWGVVKAENWLQDSTMEGDERLRGKIVRYHRYLFPSYSLSFGKICLCHKLAKCREFNLKQPVTDYSRKAFMEFSLGYGNIGGSPECQLCQG